MWDCIISSLRVCKFGQLMTDLPTKHRRLPKHDFILVYFHVNSTRSTLCLWLFLYLNILIEYGSAEGTLLKWHIVHLCNSDKALKMSSIYIVQGKKKNLYNSISSWKYKTFTWNFDLYRIYPNLRLKTGHNKAVNVVTLFLYEFSFSLCVVFYSSFCSLHHQQIYEWIMRKQNYYCHSDAQEIVNQTWSW